MDYRYDIGDNFLAATEATRIKREDYSEALQTSSTSQLWEMLEACLARAPERRPSTEKVVNDMLKKIRVVEVFKNALWDKVAIYMGNPAQL